MKLETWVIIAKLSAVLIIGLATTLGASLSQWANSDEGPGTIMWVIIISACLANAGKDVLSFLSQSFGNYKAQMKYDKGGGQTVQPPPSTVAPTPAPKPTGP